MFASPRLLLAATTAAGLTLLGALAAPPAARAEGERFAPVADPVVAKECAACHMAFPAGMLPARSWRAVTANLKDHFGEDASLDPKTTAHVTDWLVAHAADAGSAKSKALRGLAADAVPLRISETPWWKRAHDREVSPKAFANPKVGSKANCVACHAGATKGVYEDD